MELWAKLFKLSCSFTAKILLYNAIFSENLQWFWAFVLFQCCIHICRAQPWILCFRFSTIELLDTFFLIKSKCTVVTSPVLVSFVVITMWSPWKESESVWYLNQNIMKYLFSKMSFGSVILLTKITLIFPRLLYIQLEQTRDRICKKIQSVKIASIKLIAFFRLA